MVECDYCGESFDDEAAHLDHLEAVHGDELGPIDRRRVESRASGTGGTDGAVAGGLPVQGLLLGGAALAVVVIVIWYAFLSGGGGAGAEPTGLEDNPLPERGAEKWISQVEQFESNGRQHVEAGTDIDYERVPPLSGTHYGTTAGAGFYEETPPLGALVHTLEHGGVVIYYNGSALTPEAEASLRAWARNHQGTWTSIVVAPNPNDDPRGDYVLTAWRHRLVLEDYSADAVQAFVAEYLGRGPENPVR